MQTIVAIVVSVIWRVVVYPMRQKQENEEAVNEPVDEKHQPPHHHALFHPQTGARLS
jgi:hypothetical protein